MAGNHISDDQMEAYVFACITGPEADAIEAHVLECDDCALKALAFDMAVDEFEARVRRN